MAREEEKKRRFSYSERTTDDVKRRANQSGGNFDRIVKSDITTWRAQEGENCIRILPPTWTEKDDKPAGHYGMDIWIHRNVGADRQTYLCLKAMKDEDCPVCEMRQALEREGDKDAAKKLRAAKQVAMWIIDRDDEGAGPQFYTMPYTLDKEIADLSIKKSGAIIMIDHPDTGHDVSFRREGKDQQTDYNRIIIEPDESYISKDDRTQDGWLEYVTEHPVPEALNYYSPEYIQGVCMGAASPREGDELDSDRRNPERVGRGSRGREEEPDRDRSRSRGREEERSSRRGEEERGRDDRGGEPRSRRKEEDLDDEIPSEGSRSRSSRDPEPETRESKQEAEPRRRRSPTAEDGAGEKGGAEAEGGNQGVRERLTERLSRRR